MSAGLEDCLWPLERRDELTAALAAAAGIARLGPAERFELSYADVAPALTAARARRSAGRPAGGAAARARCWESSATAGARRAPARPRRRGRRPRRRGAVGLLARAGRDVVAGGRRRGRGAGGVRRRARRIGAGRAAGRGARRRATGGGGATATARDARSARPCAPPASARRLARRAGRLRRSARAAGRAVVDGRRARRRGDRPAWRRLGLDCAGRRCWLPSASASSCAAGRLAIDARRRAARTDPAWPAAPRHRAAARGGDRPPHGPRRRRRGGRVAGARGRAQRGGWDLRAGHRALRPRARGGAGRQCWRLPPCGGCSASRWRCACSGPRAPGRPSGWRSPTISSSGWSGQRTLVAQQPPELWHRDEDRALAALLGARPRARWSGRRADGGRAARLA